MGTWRRTEWRNCRPAATTNHRNSFAHKHLQPASGGTPTPLGGKRGARFATSDSPWRSAGRVCGHGKTSCTMRRRASGHKRPETAREPLGLGPVGRYHAQQPPTDEARKSCSSNEHGVFGRHSPLSFHLGLWPPRHTTSSTRRQTSGGKWSCGAKVSRRARHQRLPRQTQNPCRTESKSPTFL